MFSGTIGWAIYGDLSENATVGALIAEGYDSGVTVTPLEEFSTGNRIFQFDVRFDDVTFGSVSNLGLGRYWLGLREGNWGSAYDATPISILLSTETVGTTNRLTFGPAGHVYITAISQIFVTTRSSCSLPTASVGSSPFAGACWVSAACVSVLRAARRRRATTEFAQSGSNTLRFWV
jgi:hypothetical protein